MALLWFLAGLGLGLGLLGWSSRHFNRQVEQILHTLRRDPSSSALSPLSRLTTLTNQLHQELYHHQQQVLGWQDILYRSPIGYLQVDRADHLYWINERACQLLHIRSRPWETSADCLLLEVVRSIELDQLIDQVRTHQQAHQIDWTIHFSEWSQGMALRAYGLPLAEEHVGVFIEDRREAKNLAEDRDLWTSDVAHELKTPLTSIRLMVEALESQVGFQDRPQIGRLLQEVIRLSDLVKDLLELSRITFNQAQTLQIQAVNVPDLIHKAWLNLEPLIQQRNLSLLYQGLETFTLDADPNRLYRVFLNLLDNAIKHSPTDQTIRVQVEVSTQASSATITPIQYLCIDIIDSGLGFPVEALPHVFKRFYRTDPSRTRINPAPEGSPETFEQYQMPSPRFPSLSTDWDPKPIRQGLLSTPPQSPPFPNLGGSGLGLAIAQQIVLAHGGSIQARNHPQTGGAWLQVLLPLQID
ncbi:MAG: HAMP domain-containing histidine kinase [Acaryochloris sp. RU_4_1]|nr:HAMP domain-containing histidine kinase [Acaryochloris sp. RU_4_1]NJR54904.1 HAMP domain-containing histidine kinase [Acaryochloris sp. CRU_2_0]